MVQPNIPPQHTPPAQPLFPQAVEEDVPWARQKSTHEPLTGRRRHHLRHLPDWDPAPPGEIVVQRHRRAD
ncbi:MAG: hypothetical protein SYR96_00695 [Actinomycetota bacterium]|nr:hypothetical protein [Actinomycetota bacterium]